MCPVTIGLAVGGSALSTATAATVGAAVISTTMGVATSALSIRGQQQQAKSQAKAQANATLAERQRLMQQQSAERINQAFQNEQVAAQLQVSTTKAREARATARVSAGESGVSGISVDALNKPCTITVYNARTNRWESQLTFVCRTAL